MSEQEKESLALLDELMAKAKTREELTAAFKSAISEFPWTEDTESSAEIEHPAKEEEAPHLANP